MDRQQFYDPLVVDESHLNRLQFDIENAIARVLSDHLGEGIAWGLVLTEATPTPDLTLRLSPGAAYASDGSRVEVPTTAAVDLSVDYLGASTAPSGAGFERVIAVYVRPARTQEEAYSDPAADPTTGYLRQRETYEVLVVAGASALTGTGLPPAAPGGAVPVLLGRVVRAFGQTAFITTQILLGEVVRAARAADLHADAVERHLEVSPSDPPSMVLVVAGGGVQINGTHLAIAPGASPTFVAPSADPCIALLGVTPSGTLDVRYGAESATPVRPSTRGLLPVAWVGLDPGQTTIVDEQIEDARPWLSVDTAAIRTHRVVGTAAQTVVPLPFAYPQSAGALLVTIDGVLLDATEFTETSQVSITLGAALAGGEVVVVRALDVAPLSDDRSGLLIGGEVWVPAAGELWVGTIETLTLGGRNHRRATTGNIGFATASASTWYYLFAFEGALAGPGAPPPIEFEVSLTPPDEARLFKSGGSTHRYLAPLRTNGAGGNWPFRRIGREHVWTRTLITGDTIVLAGGAATTDTVVSLAAFVPPHARLVRVFVSLTATSAGGEAWVAAAGYAQEHHIRVGGGTGDQYAEREITLEVNATQELLYRVSATATLGIAVVSFGD